jgi:hypothetical protein
MQRKKILVGVALLVLGCFSFSYAAPLGPIRPLGNKKLSVGIENDFVFNRPVKAKVDIVGGKIKKTNSDFLLFALGLADYFNIYTRLGGGNSNEQLKWDGGGEQTIKYDYGFIWGVGANAMYSFKNHFGVGFDAQFDLATNRARSISGRSTPVLLTKGPVKTYEVQLAPYVTYDLKLNDKVKIMPYLGGYYSFYNIYKGVGFYDHAGWEYTTEDEKIRNKYNLGVLGGVEMQFLKKMSVKIEGRFLSETAISTTLSYKF